jgi:hypothetical protein
MITTTARPLGFTVKSRGRRRLLVILYWCVVALACWGFLRHQARYGVEDMHLWGMFPLFVGLTGLMGGVRTGGPVKPFRGTIWQGWTGGAVEVATLLRSSIHPTEDQTELDEREKFSRDWVHFVSYTVARWLILLLLVAYGLAGAAHVSWFSRIGPFFVFFLTITLWSLPQSLILWTEPDMEEGR